MKAWRGTTRELDREPPSEPVAPGDYFHDERDLYCVAEAADGMAMIEDCRTGTIIQLEVERVLWMHRVRRGAAGPPQPAGGFAGLPAGSP